MDGAHWGALAHFLLLPGQRHDSVGDEPLLDGIEIGALIAGKGFDNDALCQELDARGATADIPPKSNCAQQIACDFAMNRWRHLVENFFCALKQFRRIATRYDKPIRKKVTPMERVSHEGKLDMPHLPIGCRVVQCGSSTASLRPSRRPEAMLATRWRTPGPMTIISGPATSPRKGRLWNPSDLMNDQQNNLAGAFPLKAP